MGLIEKRAILVRISPPLDNLLATQLLDEFISAERRFIQRDWEPAELDGGRFCEVLGRILYHMDSDNLNQGKPLEECTKYLENDQVPHALLPRHGILHLVRVLRTVYKFRSQRGAVHISPTYTPNHMDSKFVIESVRWCMNETIRLFWQGDKEKAARAIRELLQFDVPCVGVFDNAILVQRTDLTAEEEILVLLHYAGEKGFSRADIGQYSKASARSITRSIQALESPAKRQVILLGSGKYRLTDLGARRIRNELADKLLLD